MSELVEWDDDKDAANRRKHKLPLVAAAKLFSVGDYVEQEDEREDYGEVRLVAIGRIADQVYVCVYTWRGEKRRIISFRRADPREERAFYRPRDGGGRRTRPRRSRLGRDRRDDE